MLTGEDIICFANDWEGDPLSKKHIMTALSKHNRVLWVNSIGNRNPTVSGRDLKRMAEKIIRFTSGIKHVAENIWTFTPLVLPFHGSSLARGINQKILVHSIRAICRYLHFNNPITWTFVPASADVVGNLGEKMVIYHCVDEYSQFSDTSQKTIEAIEKVLLQKSDVVIVSASKLFESKKAINPNTYLVRHGVDFDHFVRACNSSLVVPEDIAAIPGPIIGFHGLIASWIDIELIEKIARTHPEWSVVLLGKMETHDGTRHFDKSLKNIHWLGRKDYKELPAYCKAFDVAMIPFIVNELTLNANPLKMREYLAAGLPVVSTNLIEAHTFSDLVSIGYTHEHFIKQIEESLKTNSPGFNMYRALKMRKESWEAKVEELSEIVQLQATHKAMPIISTEQAAIAASK